MSPHNRQAAVGRYSLVHRQHSQRHHLVLGTPTFQPAQRLHATCTGGCFRRFFSMRTWQQLCWECWEWWIYGYILKLEHVCHLVVYCRRTMTFCLYISNSSFSSSMSVVESVCAQFVFRKIIWGTSIKVSWMHRVATTRHDTIYRPLTWTWHLVKSIIHQVFFFFSQLNMHILHPGKLI